MKVTPVRFHENAAEALRSEFFPNLDPAEYYQSLYKLLGTTSFDIYQGRGTKGGRLYKATIDQKLVGVLLVKYYSWQSIANQLYFRSDTDNASFSLASFESLLPQEQKHRVVGELAYYWVRPEFRGQRLGSELFKQSLIDFHKSLWSYEPCFTLVMGQYSGSSVGPDLQRYLLEIERSKNGSKPNGDAVISGSLVPAEQILKDQGVDIRHLSPNPKSIATEVLAKKHGFKHLGYSKNLSSLFVRCKTIVL